MVVKPSLFALLAFLVIASPADAQSVAGAQKLENKWAAEFNAGRLDRLASSYERDALIILPGGPPARGRRAIRQALGAMARHVTRLSLATTSVTPRGRDRLERGVSSFRVAGKLDVEEHSVYQVTWRKWRSGRCFIVRDTVAPMAIPPKLRP
jgi:ketosteroid isomerase-like protein